MEAAASGRLKAPAASGAREPRGRQKSTAPLSGRPPSDVMSATRARCEAQIEQCEPHCARLRAPLEPGPSPLPAPLMHNNNNIEQTNGVRVYARRTGALLIDRLYRLGAHIGPLARLLLARQSTIVGGATRMRIVMPIGLGGARASGA